MKFFLPPLIRRTVRARFLGNFVLLFGLLFLLGTSIDTLLTFHEYLEVTSGEGVQRFVQAFGFVIDFQLPRLFQLYALLWSPAVVGAAGFTFVRMQRHREIVGLQAAGISRRSLMRPIVEGTLILIVLQGLNQEFMVPKLAPLLARTHGDIGQDAIRAFAVPPTPDGSGRLWCSGTCDPVRGTMADVLVLERDDTGRTVRRIEAAAANWDEDGLWTLNEGWAIDLAELPRPPQPVASLATDLDPMVLLARHRSQFASLFGWTDISRTLKRLESGGPEVDSVEDRFRRQYSAHFSALLAGILLPFLALAGFAWTPARRLDPGRDTRDRFGPRGLRAHLGFDVGRHPWIFSGDRAVPAHPVAVSARDWRLAQYSRLISRSGQSQSRLGPAARHRQRPSRSGLFPDRSARSPSGSGPRPKLPPPPALVDWSRSRLQTVAVLRPEPLRSL